MGCANFVALPMHGQERPFQHLHAVHTHVANAGLRIIGDHLRQSDVRSTVARPGRHDRQPRDIDVGALHHHFLASGGPPHHPGRKLGHLRYRREHGDLLTPPFRHLHFQQFGNARSNRIEIVHTERDAHSPHRSEQVDPNRHGTRRSVVQDWLLEQQGGSATRALHATIGDFRHHPVDGYVMPDSGQLARGLELCYEFTKIFRNHLRTPQWIMAIPKLTGS